MAPITRPPRLLFVVSEDWYFLSHRSGLAAAASRCGFEVAVATRMRERRAELEALPVTAFDLETRRGSIAPWNVVRAVRDLRVIIRRWRPDVVYGVALGTAMVSGLALRRMREIPIVITIAGLGNVFSSRGFRARVLRQLVERLMHTLFSHEGATAVVQNDDDREVIERALGPGRVRLIPGAGVDLDHFHPLPEPDGPFAVGFAGRLLRDKGIEDLVAALRMLRGRGRPVRAIMAGRVDPGNPSSLDESAVRGWVSEGLVEWLGEVRDIREVWKNAHVAVLPSYREGLPKALLEAAACGRALIAADVPGCRAVVRPGDTGLLVPVRQPAQLAAAIEEMRAHPIGRMEMGRHGRALVEQEFSAAKIESQFVSLFREVAAGGPSHLKF
jgi:glycosyltransferase involved in cell wall biosynthesis